MGLCLGLIVAFHGPNHCVKSCTAIRIIFIMTFINKSAPGAILVCSVCEILVTQCYKNWEWVSAVIHYIMEFEVKVILKKQIYFSAY